MAKEYKEEINRECQEKINQLLKELPECCGIYVNGVLRTKSRRTMKNYLQRLLAFFKYLYCNHPYFCEQQIHKIQLSDLSHISLEDANNFLSYIYSHQADDYEASNSNNTVEGYISALNSFFGYLYKNQYIDSNPFSAVERKHEAKEHPVYLEGDANISFYNGILSGIGLSDRQLRYREQQHTTYRDYLICRILGATGIRVSELIGLDINDIDVKNTYFRVIRKGRNETEKIYFSDQLAQEFSYYLDEERPLFKPAKDEKALFLVAQGKYRGTRLSVKSVETMVKRYALAQGIPDAANFTPHKLRHTYAMNTLRASGNLRLVQQLMGHKNVATTTIYSRMLDQDLQDARNLGEYKENQDN